MTTQNSQSNELEKAIAIVEDHRFLTSAEDVCQFQEASRIILRAAKRLKEVEEERDDWKATSESWESTAKLVSNLPCGHPNDCAYDKNADGRWANIGCVWCERDQLRAEYNSLKQQLEKQYES